ncbi:MAG: MerR family DNA-binding transcriptional regulator [Alphaproteobacteria bacterium]|nr:MerR family DNA-binding transcriptional regulator [Alphaproteobacteria bacterium]
MSETFTITQLAEEFRITPRAIRFYEDKDLLRPERHGLNRVYSRRDRARLKLILRGKRLGFSLAEIREMLDLYYHGDGQVEQMRVTLKASRRRLEQLEDQRREIEEAIAELKDGIRQLERILAEKGVGAEQRAAPAKAVTSRVA